VREHLGLDKRRWTDQQVLAWAQHMSGREVVLVDEIPEDEEIVLICSPEPYVAGSLKAVCSECGTTVYHSRHAPPNARKICTRCGPRLGH